MNELSRYFITSANRNSDVKESQSRHFDVRNFVNCVVCIIRIGLIIVKVLK